MYLLVFLVQSENSFYLLESVMQFPQQILLAVTCMLNAVLTTSFEDQSWGEFC